MSTHCNSVLEYMAACKALLATPDLSDHEQQAVEDMVVRLSEQLRSWKKPSSGV